MHEEVLVAQTILQRLRKGDALAFRAIYDQFWSRLYKSAIDKVSDPECAEEIIQDIFVDIWERREMLEISDLEHYLFRAVKYKVLDHIRSQIVRRKHEDSVLSIGWPREDSSEVEEELAFEELQIALQAAMSGLPDKTRNIFHLSRIEELSTREISDSLQIPERTVAYHLAQAVRALRIHLKDYIPSVVAALLASLVR